MAKKKQQGEKSTLRSAQGSTSGGRQQEEKKLSEATTPGARSASTAGFPIVGIGASAGGLDALEQLLEAMPDQPGLALVVIQHLDPTKKSLAPELLAKRTKMQVTQVEDDPDVKPNYVYFIPPNKYLSIAGGKLHLSAPEKPRGARMVVDFFLRALAEDQNHCAVGVILSGTGTDGALGVKAIKAADGLVIAQDPASAQHEGMPRSAIETGNVDHILPPEKIPEVLTRYAQHPYVREAAAAASQEETKEEAHFETAGAEDMGRILVLLRAHTKHDFRNYKEKTLVRRTRRRMCLHHIEDYDAYLNYLRQHPDEIDALAKDLLITVTDFFREPEAWEELRRVGVRPIIETKDTDEPIRIWTPACATGEEPYSMAMLILEELKRAEKNCPLNLFASDIDKGALDYARAGRYPKSIEADVSSERLKRFFTIEEGGSYYRVNNQLRESVVFAEQNLIADPPFSKLDLLCCRNLLIYLKPDVQEKIIALFHFALREGGVLFLGSAETIGRQNDLFQTVDKRWRIFRRVGPTQHDRVEIPISEFEHRREVEVGPSPTQRREARLTHMAQQRLLDLLAPTAVLINRKWRILYVCGDVDPYLTHKPGMPSDDLLDKARRGLRSKLRAAVRKALTEDRTVTVTARVKRDSSYYPVAITVRLIHDHEQQEDLALVMFEEKKTDAIGVGEIRLDDTSSMRQQGKDAREDHAEETAPTTGDPWLAHRIGDDSHVDERAIIRQLEAKLAAAKDDLRSTVEQLEASNEEYKASNEEVMSINEELQSTNEELETSKEELQSLNEELATVNSQLAAKVEEVEKKHSDLENLLSATDVATICLDADLKVRWFTPAAQHVIRLKDADKGRPLADLNHDFTRCDLVQMAEQVLQKLTPVEDEVECDDQRIFLRRVTPYRADDHRIGGVVITFFDITRRKKDVQALVAAKALSDKIVDTVREGMLVLDGNLRVLRANQSFYDRFMVAPSDTEGRLIYELGNSQWDIPELRRLLEEVLPANNVFNDYVVEHEFETIGRRIMLLNGRQVDHLQQILLAIEDITDRKRTELELQNLNELLEQQVSERTAMLKLLQDVTRAANAARTVEEAMRAALQRIGEYNGWQVGHVWRLADDGCGQMVSSGIWHITETAEQAVAELEKFQRICEQTRFSAGQGLVGTVMATREPKWLDDVEQFEEWQREGARDLGLGAAIAFPVTVNGELVAVLEFFTDHPAKREERFMEIMPDVGIQLGHVIERKRLEQAIDAATTEQLRYIADELHDSVAQQLTGTTMFSEVLRQKLENEGSAHVAMVGSLIENLRETMKQLRLLSHGLRPVDVDAEGLMHALRKLASDSGRLYNVEFTFQCEDPVTLQNNTAATHLYRIAQEAIQNAVKHGDPKHIDIRLSRNEDEVVLTVRDDGGGFPAGESTAGGSGHRIMEHRAALIGGQVDIESEEGIGVTVTCRVRQPNSRER